MSIITWLKASARRTHQCWMCSDRRTSRQQAWLTKGLYESSFETQWEIISRKDVDRHQINIYSIHFTSIWRRIFQSSFLTGEVYSYNWYGVTASNCLFYFYLIGINEKLIARGTIGFSASHFSYTRPHSGAVNERRERYDLLFIFLYLLLILIITIKLLIIIIKLFWQ